MDHIEAIKKLFEENEVVCSNHMLHKICDLIDRNKTDELKNYVEDDIYMGIYQILNQDLELNPDRESYTEELIELDSETIIKKKIPTNLRLDRIEIKDKDLNKDTEILNFLNNNCDLNIGQEDSVASKMDLIFQLLEEKGIILVQGDTGCGKTTKIPKYLLKKYKSIVCTQPRRIAAIAVAKKVAQDMNTKIGDLVGYSVRFDDCTSKNTKLKYVTDGILLREIIQTGDLQNYDCLIIDEAHERTINIDILLGFCKMLIKRGTHIKIVLMSATLATEKFIEFFNCPFIDIKHKVHPLQNYYLKHYNSGEWFIETLKTVIQLENTEKEGDILVFLTGQEDIKEASGILQGFVNQKNCRILTIYSAMSIEDQELVFEKTKQRKIILSTNICETSVTIENIVYVVDSGRVKQMRHANNLGMDILETIMISKAQARQRSGRAGRTRPGKVFRIYTKDEYMKMADSTLPEILTTNVCNGILTIKSLGILDLNKFEMIDLPRLESINDALEYLFLVRAVDNAGNITQLGRRLSSIPLDPNLAVSLIKSIDFECFDDVATIAAMLTVDQIHSDVRKDSKLFKKFTASKKSWFDNRGDFFMLLKIYRAWEKDHFSYRFLKAQYLNLKNMWQAKLIKEQLYKIFKIKKSTNELRIMEAFSCGYFMNIAKIKEDAYFTVFKETECFIHSSSSLYKKNAKYVLYHSIVRTKRELLKYCNLVTPEVLCKSVNHVFNEKIKPENTEKND
jgi:HrpA-like RNA helicase